MMKGEEIFEHPTETSDLQRAQHPTIVSGVGLLKNQNWKKR
jgi:hypothetical protein